MPVVLTDDLQKLVLDKAAEFTDSLNKQFRSTSSPTPSSDSLTNPIGTGNGPVSLPAPDAPVTAPLVAPDAPPPSPAPTSTPPPPPDPNSMLDKNGVIAYVHQKAADFGLDPAAVLAVAAHEGLNTAPGSHWTLPGEGNISFGPPSWYGNGAGSDIIRQHGANAAAWSWTPPGIDYWLGQVAQSAKGLTGTQAISAIVHGFERPREDLVAGEIKNASNDYATYSQSGGSLTTAGPAVSSDTTNPVNPSDSTPSATTTPSSPSILDQAASFTSGLNQQFQNATNGVANAAGQAKSTVLQQAQTFTDGLNQQFKSATDAIGSAAGAVDSADKQYGPNALLTSGEHALGQGVGAALSGGIQQAAANDLNNGALGPGVPQPIQSAAAGLITAPGVLDNLQTISSLAQQHPDSSTMGVLPDTSQLTPDESSQYQNATIGVGGIVGEPGGHSQRPLFGRGGVPGGTGERPTMPAPTQPQDLETALAQSQVQATLKKIQNMGYTADEAAGILRTNGVPEEHIQTALNPPERVQVPTSTRPTAEPKPSLTLDTSAPDAPPHVTYDPEGNVVSGTPSEPPTPPTPPDDTSTLPAEPAPDGQPLRGAAANYTPSRVPNPFNPRSQGPQAVQEAVDSRNSLINTARLDAANAVRGGSMTQADSQQMIGQTIGKANQQFQNDILNSRQGVELKSVLAQHGSIDSQGENVVGNPKPAGWVDGASLPGSGLSQVWVSPEVATIVKNTLGDTSNPLTAAPASIVSQIKQFYLNSPFHFIYGAGQATNLGLSRGAPTETANALARSTFNAIDPTAKAFDSYMLQPRTLDIAHRFVQDGGTLSGLGKLMDIQGGLKLAAARGAVAGGLTGGKTYLDETSQGTPQDQALQDAATKALIAGGLTAAGTAYGPAIFERQIPTLKLEFYDLLTKQGVQGTTAATMMNNIFGGQNLVRMARAQSTQDIMRTVTLAPDLWEGIGRTLLGSVRNPDNAKMVATTAATSAILLQAANMVASGHPTVATPAMDVAGVHIPAMQGNQPGYELQVEVPHEDVAGLPGAPTKPAGTVDHIDILGSQIRGIAQGIGTAASGDPASAAGTFFSNHLSPLAGIAKNMIQDNNPATGKPITDAGAPPLQQAADQAKFAAGQLVPIAGSSIDKGTAAAGPVGGAVDYLTGRNITSETPDQAANKQYYGSKDQALYDMANWVKAQPEYKSATPAEQRSMLDNYTIQYEHYLSEQANRAPLDKGLPPKYRGVSDPRQQQAIDDAKVKVNAYDRDPRHSERPTAEERRMAAHEPTSEYTRATQARTTSNKGLQQAFQQRFTAP